MTAEEDKEIESLRRELKEAKSNRDCYSEELTRIREMLKHEREIHEAVVDTILLRIRDTNFGLSGKEAGLYGR